MLSGVGAKLGALGVSLSVGAAVKTIIDFDDKLIQLGTVAGISAQNINGLKRQIYAAATAPDIKINPDGIVNAMNQIMEATGDLTFAENNIRNIGLMIKATGASGEAVGGMLSEFQKFGYSAETVTNLMDNFSVIGDKGAFTIGEFAKAGSAIMSAYSVIGTSAEDATNAMAAMQIIMKGTKNAEAAVTSLSSVMAELADPAKQDKLLQLGISVRDSVTGEFRDLNELLPEIVEKSNEFGNLDFLGSIFGQTAMQAVRAYSNFGDTLQDVLDVGDAAGSVAKKAANNAQSLKSNIQNLQTAFVKFADTNLSGQLNKFTDGLNKFAENPERFERVFKVIAGGLGAIVAVKGVAKIAGVVQSAASFLGQKAQIAGGGTSSAGGLASGSTTIPVFVTNWRKNGSGSSGHNGSSSGSNSQPQMKGLNSVYTYNSSLLKNAAIQTGVMQTVAVAGYQVVEAFSKIQSINADESLTQKEKDTEKGGAIGKAAGTVVGTGLGVAAGALAAGKIGAVIGTMIAPGVGTVIGGAIGSAGGALVGWLGGMAGEKIGRKIGDAMSKEIEVPPSVKDELQSFPKIPEVKPTAQLEGNAQMDVRFTIDDCRTSFSTNLRSNTTPFKIRETGSVHTSREAGY